MRWISAVSFLAMLSVGCSDSKDGETTGGEIEDTGSTGDDTGDADVDADADDTGSSNVDEDGDAVPVNKMARRYQYTDRKTGEVVINRPTFWKRNREGGYDDITDKVKFLSKGSVVITQVSFRMYAMSQHYGVATDMGKNIIVVWQKPYSGGNAAPQDTTPEVPFFE